MSHLFVAEAAERLNFEGHLSEVLLGILANAGKPNGDGCHGCHGCHGSRFKNPKWSAMGLCQTNEPPPVVLKLDNCVDHLPNMIHTYPHAKLICIDVH